MKNLNNLCIFAGALALSACSSGTANCNDDSVKNTIVKVISSSVAGWGGKDLLDNGTVKITGVSDVSTTAHDGELDTYTCEAKLTIEINGTAYEKPVQYDLSYLEDKKDTSVAVHDAGETAMQAVKLAATTN